MAFEKKRCNTCQIYDCGTLCTCGCHRDPFDNSAAAPKNYGGGSPDNSTGAQMSENQAMKGLAELFG